MRAGDIVFLYIQGNLTKGKIVEILEDNKLKVRLFDNTSHVIVSDREVQRTI